MYLVLFVILMVRWFLADTDRCAQCLRFYLLCVIRRRSACGYHVLERCRLSLFLFFFDLGREIFGKISHDPL